MVSTNPRRLSLERTVYWRLRGPFWFKNYVALSRSRSDFYDGQPKIRRLADSGDVFLSESQDMVEKYAGGVLGLLSSEAIATV